MHEPSLNDVLTRLCLQIRLQIDHLNRARSHNELNLMMTEIRRLLNKYHSKIRDEDPAKNDSLSQRDIEYHQQQHATASLQLNKNFDVISSRLQDMEKSALLLSDTTDPQLTRRNTEVTSSKRPSSSSLDEMTAIARQLAETVKSSGETIDELRESSEVAGETGEEMRHMGSAIGQSRKLISKYDRRETTDRVLILFAYLFFFACVFYVLKRRVFGSFDPISFVWSSVKTLINLMVSIVNGWFSE